MAELGQTSSMTSVTEEDTSADSESDTTESSYSHVTSSVLSSTDTDDKLTPGLTNVSISNTTSAASDPKKRRHMCQEVEEGDKDTPCEALSITKSDDQKVGIVSDVNENAPIDAVKGAIGTTVKGTNFVFAYGSNPLPLEHAGGDIRRKRKDIGGQKCSKTLISRCKENLGIDDTDNKLSTDFSDTSSIQAGEDRSNNNEFEVDSIEEEDGDDNNAHRPFYPDMSSASWYQARCFDHYWAHYNFVMEWYQEHVKAVSALQGQMYSPWRFPPPGQYPGSAPATRSERSKRKKRSRRARSRRAKERQKASQRSSESLSASLTGTDADIVYSASSSASSSAKGNRVQNHNESGEDVEDIEMEITDEMMEFFTTSFKHRMERDGAKNEGANTQNDTRLSIEEAKAGDQGPTSAAPSERPGVRRTAEMREIYGAGAPMIHGMETALQMTYDRISDRHQPKMWPNMPLKIVFA